MKIHSIACAAVLMLSSAAYADQSANEQEQSLVELYRNASNDEIAQAKTGAKAGDVNSTLHYALWSLAHKDLEEAFFWLSVLSIRAALHEVAEKGFGQKVNEAVTYTAGAMLVELSEEDPAFKEQFAAFMQEAQTRILTRVRNFIIAEEAKRPRDAYTAKRAELIKEMEAQVA